MKYQSLAVVLGCFLVASCGGGGGPCTTTVCGAYSTEYTAQAGLASIGAASINNAGYTGSGIKIAVVDTGIHSSHAEFSGKTIYGTDFSGGSDGYGVDTQGHGTHVASIIAGTRDAAGIRGVAYDAILYDYKVGDDDDIVTSWLYSDTNIASTYDRHVTDNIKVSNNSWGDPRYLSANNYTESSIRGWRTKTIAALRAAQQNGTVFVFATGNDLASDPKMFASLPYRITELADEWLAVVAVDSNLKETRYTNRCGVSNDFCVTAPGGGDTASVDGIYAADAKTGTYTRKSGTSMAAPHVSGLVATVMGRFSSLTAAQVVTRIKTTATYDGLTGYSGCTSSTCTTAQMEAIFGHGLVQPESATTAISSLTYSTDGYVYSGAFIDLSKGTLSLPSGIGPRVGKALARTRFAVFDSFDGATFWVSGAELFSMKEIQEVSPLGYAIKNTKTKPPSKVMSFSQSEMFSDLGLPVYFSRSTDAKALASAISWGEKIGFMPSPSFIMGQTKNQLEAAIYEDKRFSIRPFIQFSDTSNVKSGGGGLNLSLRPRRDTIFHSSFYSGTPDLSLSFLKNSTSVPGHIRSFDIGLEHNITLAVSAFVRSSFNSIDDVPPTETQFGLSESTFVQAMAGVEYDLGQTKIAIGGYDPGHFHTGNVAVLVPTGRDKGGRVLYDKRSIEADSKFNIGAFFALKHNLDSGGKDFGSLNLSVQQSPYNPNEVARVSFGYQLHF